MFSFLARNKSQIPTPDNALPGRSVPIAAPPTHVVLGTPMDGPWPEPHAFAMFGLGCFWGAERTFWQVDGVISTAVGYAAGITENPTYREVCSGQTGHNEVVRVVFDPSKTSFAALVALFFESHNPTQGMRQGNDVGTQYRSGVYAYGAAQLAEAEAACALYGTRLEAAGYEPITTEVIDAPPFYFAEVDHQQYLHKNPGGYCGIGGTGVSCPIGVAAER